MQTNPVFPSINEASELIVAPEDLLPVSCAFEVYIHVFYHYLVRQLLLYNNILDLSTFIHAFFHTQAGVRYSIDHPDVYIESNLIGFYNILEACRHSYDEADTDENNC